MDETWWSPPLAHSPEKFVHYPLSGTGIGFGACVGLVVGFRVYFGLVVSVGLAAGIGFSGDDGFEFDLDNDLVAVGDDAAVGFEEGAVDGAGTEGAAE